jgi:glutathione peroxidase-family protein
MNSLKSVLFFCALTVIFAARSLTLNYGVGDSVSDFKLKNVDGKYISLADFKDSKGAIIIFDCNTCPYSKAYNERIIALHDKYTRQGYPVIAINSNDPAESPGDSFDEMVRISKEKKYGFPYVYDETQSVAKAFGATNTPHVFVLKNENGKFNVAYIGAIDDNPRDKNSVSKKYVEDAVDALLAEKPVTTSKTKAIGCGIKWKDS